MKQPLLPAIHPEYQLYQQGDRVFCTSKQVAEAFGKHHFSVLRDIRALDCPEDFRTYNFVCTSQNVDMPNGGTRKETLYLITEEGFMFSCMSYRGKKASAIKIAFIERFKAMQELIRDYILSKDEFMPFTQAIADTYGDSNPWHYKNEIDMIYRIVLGMDAKHFREIHGLQKGASIRPYLTDAQHRAIRKLQTQDIRLLYTGADYDTRKFTLASKAITAGLSSNIAVLTA